jgi:hypothetical protein
MPQERYYLDWQEVNTNWEDLDINWEDVYILIEVGQTLRGGGGYSEYVKGNPWERMNREIGEEKTKKFIKIFCKINDLEYEKVVESNSSIKIKVSHFERVFQNIPNIRIKF